MSTLFNKLEASLSPAGQALLHAVIAAQHCNSKQGLYIAGGVIRDLLLDISHDDIDFVVEGDVEPLVRRLQQKYGGHLRLHPRFKTANWILDESVQEYFSSGLASDEPFFSVIDFATARTEYYPESGALPVVEPGAIEQDLHRRDFTINALALELCPEPGRLLDYYNGQFDLENGVIRVLHHRSFIDDPTRMMRAVRYEQRLGFKIEPYTLQLIQNALPAIDRVSGDRLRNELNLILGEQKSLHGLRRLYELDILTGVHPCLYVDEWVIEAVQMLQELRRSPRLPFPINFDNWHLAYFSLLLLRLSLADIEAVCNRLRFSQRRTRHFKTLQTCYHNLHALTPDTPASIIVGILEPATLTGWITLYAAAENDFQRQIVEKMVAEWQYIHPPYSGHDLRERGVPQGPVYGQILSEIRRAQLDGEITTENEIENYLQVLLNNDD